jgi:hypothetical protein
VPSPHQLARDQLGDRRIAALEVPRECRGIVELLGQRQRPVVRIELRAADQHRDDASPVYRITKDLREHPRVDPLPHQQDFPDARAS